VLKEPPAKEKENADIINSTIKESVISAMGFCRTTPLEVVYGPKELGGMGMLDIFIEQGAAKAAYVIQQVRRRSPLGQVLLGQLKWAQLVTGVERAILEHPEVEIPQLDGEVWIQTERILERIDTGNKDTRNQGTKAEERERYGNNGRVRKRKTSNQRRRH
jgi:hypothetical protein